MFTHSFCLIYDVDALRPPEAFAAGMARLPWDARREKVMRFRFDKDRRLCLGAGLLAACALRRAGVQDLTLSESAYGKPYLRNVPQVRFNLSHSGHIVVCAVSDAPLGADVEALVRPYDDQVAKTVYQPEEVRFITEQPDADRAFFRFWTRKESYIKATGTGLSVDPKSFSVLGKDTMPDGCVFHETEHAEHLICVCSADAAMDFDVCTIL